MTQRYTLETSPSYRIPLPEQQTIPSYIRPLFPFSVRLRLSPSLLPLLSRAGFRLALSRLGTQLARIQLPISRLCDAGETFGAFRRLLASTSQSAFAPYQHVAGIRSRVDDVPEEVSAVEAYEPKSRIFKNFRGEIK